MHFLQWKFLSNRDQFALSSTSYFDIMMRQMQATGKTLTFYIIKQVKFLNDHFGGRERCEWWVHLSGGWV